MNFAKNVACVCVSVSSADVYAETVESTLSSLFNGNICRAVVQKDAR